MNKIINRRILILLIFVSAIGIAIIWWVANSADKHMRVELLTQARIAAQAINIKYVASLTGSEKDLKNPAYHLIKNQMRAMRKAIKKCKFLYLMGRRSDGVVFFFADSLPPDAKDYAPPGLVYDEVSDSYLRIFEINDEAVVGPVTDRWGTLITALVPLRDPYKGNVIAVLGMDVDANYWNKEILSRCFFPFTVMLLFVFLILLLVSRGKVAKTLRQSENKLRTALDATPFPVAVVDLNDDKIFFWSQSAFELFGHTAPTASKWYQIAYPDPDYRQEVIERWKPFLEIARESGQPVNTGEYRVTCKDGSVRICELYATFLLDNFIVTFNDITDRKQAEEALKESEEKLRLLFDNSPIGICTVDLLGNFVTTNPAYEQMLGYSKAELRGLSFFDVTHPDYRPKNKELFQKMFSLESTGFKFEKIYIRKDGAKIKASVYATAVIDDRGNTIFGTAFVEDITERKQAEEALAESEQRLNEAQRLASIGSWVQDVRSNKLIWSDETFRIFEIDKGFSGELFGVFLSSIHPEDKDAVVKAYSDSLKTKKPYAITHKLLMPDGRVKYVHEYCETKYDESGNPVKSIGTVQDITERKKAEKEQEKLQAQLIQAQKMEAIVTLAGGIAHDFNNILFPIVGYAEMLLMDTPEDSPVWESLNQIHTSSLRAKSLVKQILTFSRQEGNKLMLMKMQPIVKEALKLIRSTIPTTIDIKQDINPDCGVIKADPTQIHQIVMNLATNAYHAMEEAGGELKVSLKKVKLGEYDRISPDMAPGIYACLIVADTGKGMDKNLTDKIFDPYFTTKAIGKGTGMGLSVVHGIVTAMGGAIQVYSEPGKGTAFHVYLPVEKILLEEQATTSKKQIQGGTEQILRVDDEEAILNMEKRMLERLGYQVTSRFSSLEALEAFRADPDKFDLIITDMAMPNMPGDKLSVELTKIRPDIPILLCTGFSEIMSEERAASLGIKGFLFKPIVMKDLAQKIREVLDEN